MNVRSVFFKIKAPKKFGYTPRYYDERKERREKLFAKYENNVPQAEKMEREMRLRSAFTEKRRFSTTEARSEMRSRTIRLFVILVCVIGLIYMLLRKYNLTEQVF